MIKNKDKYFTALHICSHNGIFNFVLSNRNYGKTWGFKKRAFVRAKKHHKKTLWIRRFKKEVKQASAKFYKPRDLQKFCGFTMYDKDSNPNGEVKKIGNTFYIKTKSGWQWFLEICCLSDSNAMRSADDVDTDTIVFDEFTTTPEKYRRYRGNEVDDFIDIYHSAKRTHEVKCFFLGNKESISNPYFTYFGVKPLPVKFEGIRKYRKGSLIVQQINNKASLESEYDKKNFDLFKGTSYGNYIYEDEYKQSKGIISKHTPANAGLYIQLYWRNMPIKICISQAQFYVSASIDKNKPVYVENKINKFSHEYILIKKYKKLFGALINAVADNRVHYESEALYENILSFYQWLGI